MSDFNTHKLIEHKQQLIKQLEVQVARLGEQAPAQIAIELDRLRTEVDHYLRTQRLLYRAGLELEPPPPARGLIVIVSPRPKHQSLAEQSYYQAIDYHRASLEQCWLLVSATQTGASEAAQELAKYLKQRYITHTIHTIQNAADLSETQQVAQSIFQSVEQLGEIRPSQLVVDISGDNKIMSAALAISSAYKYPMQYIHYLKDAEVSVPVLLHPVA
jgi:hypothetical protein